MTSLEQIRFVKDLSDTIAREIIVHIKAKRIPINWDGHELRVLLADKHAASAAMSRIRSDPRSTRAREYQNAKMVGSF